MTQTNTTQNKEELIKDWKDQFRIVEGSRWTFPSEVRISWEALKELVDKSISQAHQSGIEEGKKSNRDFVIKLKADMAHAIGFCRGLGHPETYLEKNYPELCSKENK